MTTEDYEFIEEHTKSLLFYGEFEDYLTKFLREIFKNDFTDYGFGRIEKNNDFLTAYWFLLSWLVDEDLVEYGTSPRGAWITEEGERFKKLIMENENALEEAREYIHNKYN